jgi:small subunit ribosomal protein S4
MGLAASRRQARQMIRHGHFLINGKLVDIPSYVLKESDEVGIRQQTELTDAMITLIAQKKLPAWLSFEVSAKKGTIMKTPDREEMDVPVKEQLIVEFYSR